jgi:hypothetical protein
VPKFRKHLPPDCPPSEAEAPDGERFYRLVTADQLDNRAFLSLQEEGKACPPHASPCQWAGVSLCKSRADIDAPRKISPKKFGHAKIAEGTLTKDLGVTESTPTVKVQSHTTYWPYESAKPWLHFKIIDEQRKDE